MVIDADASSSCVDAVRDRKLQIVDIAGADALAHRLPFARAGRIAAGHYDPVRELPPTDKRVIQIDALVIGNGCARESVTQGVITALIRVFPDFVRVNRERANLTGLPWPRPRAATYDEQGPDPVGEYVPWVIDIMPTARWLQIIFALFDAVRAPRPSGIASACGASMRRASTSRVMSRACSSRASRWARSRTMAPQDAASGRRSARAARFGVSDLGRLAERCRRQSLSMLVPMGHEMGYRYQEGLIADLLRALKRFRERLDR